MAHNLTIREHGETRIFVDQGTIGRGLAGYRRLQGYQPSLIPTKVGARYFLGDDRSKFDDVTDQALPIAMGNKWDGGKEAYQLRVYNAMKAHPDVKNKESDLLKPPRFPPIKGGSMGLTGHQFLKAPGRERPDFTIYDAPDATLTDTNSEEIEFDQALSLAGSFGRDFLGMQMEGLMAVMTTAHAALGTADFEQTVRFTLATRTGAFKFADPELIWAKDVSSSLALTATATGLEPLVINVAESDYGEPFMYVAPRLFSRIANDLTVSIAVGDLDFRMASISVRLNFRAFIELLERFADVTLL